MKREFLFYTKAALLFFICPSSSLSVQRSRSIARTDTVRSFLSRRRSSPPVINMSPSSSDNKGDENSLRNATMKKEEYLASIKACSNAVLFSALIDTTSNAAACIRSNSAILDVFALLPALWKISFAGGIQYAASRYQKTSQIVVEDKKLFIDLCRTMTAVWELTAWLTTAAVLIDAMNNFHHTWAVRIAVLAAAGLGFAGRSISYRETRHFESNEEARRTGLRLVRTMAVCAGALLMDAVISPLTTFASESHWAEKGFVLSGIPTPFVLAKLLWLDMRRSTLKAVVATDTEMTSKQKPVAAYTSLFTAGKKFYSEAASMFKAENIFKILFFFLMLIKMHQTPISQLVPLALVVTILWLST